MMKKYICFVLALIMLTAPIESLAEVTKIDEDLYGDTGQNFTPIDLTGVANMDFADEIEGDGKGGWTDQGAINDMRNFDMFGKVNLLGVDFDIIDPAKNDGKAVITLRGQNLMTLPNEVEIPINQTAAGLYILHSAAWVVSNIATYTLVYGDGSTYDVPIRNGKENFNFWGTGSSDVAKTAWLGSNASTGTVSIYMFAMENPYPVKTISKLVCKTTGSDAFDIIVGVTLTDKGPYLMEEADMGNPDTSDWYDYEQPTYDTIVGTVLDASFLLDAPAGKHGWLKKDGDKLVFEDGTEADFWGTNTGYSLLVGHDRIDKVVDRMAACGFNLLRFHNYMASGWGEDNIFASSTTQRDQNPIRMESLCYAIAKCKEKGIYIYLDLNVYPTDNENMNIRGKGVTSPSNEERKSLAYFDEEQQRIDEEFITELLNTYNPYTGLRIGEDPAIAFMDFKNETAFFSTNTGYVSTYYGDDLQKLFNEWLTEKYQSTDNLRAAWRFAGVEGLLDGESLEEGTIEYPYANRRPVYTRPRQEDAVHFMADAMSDYSTRIKDLIRSIGYKGLATHTTLWGGNYAALLYTLTNDDIVDVHAYWSHPSGIYLQMTGMKMGNNLPISMLENKNFGFYRGLLNNRVYGMPLTITEWDECDVNPTISEGATLMGAMSSLQNWVPLNFAFGSRPDEVTENVTTGSGRVTIDSTEYFGDPNVLLYFWNLNNNPVKMGTMPAASIMKLRGDVKEADTGFFVRYSQNDYFSPDRQTLSDVSTTLGMIGKTGRYYDKLEYDENYNDNDLLYKAYMTEKLGVPAVSVTGEIRTDMANASFELNTERSQAVVGRLSGKRFETDDMIVEVTNRFATVNLTSLSDDPIWDADKLLITAAGDQRNTDEVRSRDGTQITRGGTAPIIVEPIKGRLTIKTNDEITVYRINSTGERLGTARVEKDENGWSVLCLRAEDTCMHYEVVRTEKASGARSANPHIEYPQIEVKPLFDDMDGFEYAEKQINRNVMLGYMNGVTETSFAPGADMTKGDFIAAVVGACKLVTAFGENFADVSANDPNYNAIGRAKQLGVVNGDEDGSLHPDSPISRSDAMTILARAMEAGNVQAKQTEAGISGKYKDCSALPDYAVDGADKMLSQPYMSRLFGGEYLEPDKNLSRAETACIVYGILWE